ncbi:MAG: MptD family putative ECF transporter S component [Raoultibacter sp.]|jgi:energy-coupling factor transport system substrate-specific component
MSELVKEKKALKSKDLIVAGAFAALYVVLMFVSVSVMGFVPILYICAPLLLPIILGPVYMFFVTKVPKRGAILILGILVGLLTSMGGVWQAGVWALFISLIAELIASSGKYISKARYLLSYVVFACTNMGPFWMLLFAKSAFLEQCMLYYGADYAASLDALTPDWLIIVLIAMALVGGLVGGLFGQRLISKHFKKAGIV